eukprot:COSAG02_NODE_1576_length_11868_cov_82.967117_12_plen_102_part_00
MMMLMRQAVLLFVLLALAGRVSGQAVVQCANWAGQFDEMNRVCCADQPGGECATGKSKQRALLQTERGGEAGKRGRGQGEHCPADRPTHARARAAGTHTAC